MQGNKNLLDTDEISPRDYAGHQTEGDCVPANRTAIRSSAVAGREDQSIEVNRPPAVSASCPDRPALFVGGRFDEDCLAVADAGGEEFPEAVTDTAARVADEDSRR